MTAGAERQEDLPARRRTVSARLRAELGAEMVGNLLVEPGDARGGIRRGRTGKPGIGQVVEDHLSLRPRRNIVDQSPDGRGREIEKTVECSQLPEKEGACDRRRVQVQRGATRVPEGAAAVACPGRVVQFQS